jgi:uncharacterized protein YbjQ (UPF0145 family)
VANLTNDSVLIVFVALAGIALLAQAAVLALLFLTGKKALEKLQHDFDELRETAMPVLHSSREVLAAVIPSIRPVTADFVQSAANIRTISADMAEITGKVRGQVEELQSSAAVAMERLQQHAGRLDAMIVGLLDVADRLSRLLQSTLGVSARQLAGVLAAVKAIVESLRNSPIPSRSAQPASDQETFI